MTDAWQTLRAGGLPLATSRDARAPTAAALAAAVREVMTGQPTGRDAEALGALLLAWRAHFPGSFAAELGGEGAALLAWAAAALPDENRRLKLRRIAIENLATVL